MRIAMFALGLGAVAGVGAMPGCAGECPNLAAREQALRADPPGAGMASIDLHLPLFRADALVAEALAGEPLEKTIDASVLGVPALAGVGALHARVTSLHFMAAADNTVRLDAQVEVAEAQQLVTSFDVVVDVTPVITPTSIDIGFGPANVVKVTPELGPLGGDALGRALDRWTGGGAARAAIGEAIQTRLARRLADHVFEWVRGALLARIGERAHIHIGLPDVPIFGSSIQSHDGELVVHIFLALPRVSPPTPRAPARAAASPPASPRRDDIEVDVPASAAAALANWAIDRAILPTRYTRDLEPRADGEYRPVFEYVASDPRPMKVHIFQERGGCAYFEVGMRPELALAASGDKLEVGVRDRYVEDAEAGVVVDTALWIKQLITGSVDRSRAFASSIQFSIGGRAYTTRATRATFADDQIELGLAVDIAPPK